MVIKAITVQPMADAVYVGERQNEASKFVLVLLHTRLRDLTLVCANCHRMLHRAAKCVTLEDLRLIVQTLASAPTTPDRACER